MRRFLFVDAERNLVGDGDAVAFESNDFFGMVGQDADVAEAEVDEDLGADAGFVLDQALTGGLAVELAAGVHVNLRELAGFVGLIDAEAAAGVMEIEKHAAIFFSDGFEGAVDEISAIAGCGAEDVAREAVRVDANEGGRLTFEFAADECDVLVVVNVARVGDHAEITETSSENRLSEAADVTFVLHAIANQIGNREQFQIVRFAEFDELRHAGHGAVFTHNLADDSGGSETRDAREVDAGFGLAGANENAAVARTKRKNVAGARKILRACFRIDGGEDGDGAVACADAGRDPDACVDCFGERSAVHAGVNGRHEREVKLVAAVFRERHTDEASAELGHEVDGVRRDFFGGHGEVAFVFAVLVVNEDDHAAVADFFDGLFDGGEMGAVVGHEKFSVVSPQSSVRERNTPWMIAPAASDW